MAGQSGYTKPPTYAAREGGEGGPQILQCTNCQQLNVPMLSLQHLILQRVPLSAISAPNAAFEYRYTRRRDCDFPTLRNPRNYTFGDLHLRMHLNPKDSKQKQKKSSPNRLSKPPGLERLTPIARTTPVTKTAPIDKVDTRKQIPPPPPKLRTETFPRELLCASLAGVCRLGRWHAFRWNKPGQIRVGKSKREASIP
jgi:hypothetical protein